MGDRPTLRERLERFAPDDDNPSVVEFADLVRDIEAATRPAEPLDVERLDKLLRDHCHDSADEGLPLRVRHTHLTSVLRDDCAAAIAAEYARLEGAGE